MRRDNDHLTTRRAPEQDEVREAWERPAVERRVALYRHRFEEIEARLDTGSALPDEVTLFEPVTPGKLRHALLSMSIV